jgi:hypothetical protein
MDKMEENKTPLNGSSSICTINVNLQIRDDYVIAGD